MNDIFWSKKNVKAPFKSTLFLRYKKLVFKGLGERISTLGLQFFIDEQPGLEGGEEGAIVKNFIKERAIFDILFNLIEYPNFKRLSEDEIFQMELVRLRSMNDFNRITIRCSGMLHTTTEGPLATNSSYRVEFNPLEREIEASIERYLAMNNSNVKYLAEIITKSKGRKLLYPIASFLGFDTKNEAFLCREVMHELRTLENYSL